MWRDKKFLIGVAVSVVIIVLIGFQINFRDVLSTLKKANYTLIIVSMIVFLVSFIFRAVRWHYILYEVRNVSFMPLFSSIMIGFMANCIFPVRLGEFVRAYIISKYARISKTTSVASVLLTRMFDGFAIIAIWLGLVIVLGYKKSESIWMAGFIGVIIYAITGVLFILFYRNHKATSRLFERFFALFSLRVAVKVRRGIDKFVKGMGVLKSPRRILMSFILSLCVWGTIVLSTWMVIESFHFSEIMPYYTPFIVTALVAIGISIPSSPSNLGTFEVSSVLAVKISNSSVTSGEALTFSILLHLSQLIPVIILGFVFMWISHLRLSQLAVAKNDKLPSLEN